MKETPCNHKPDWNTVTVPTEAKTDPFFEGVVDVNCIKCGLSGSVRIKTEDIQWE